MESERRGFNREMCCTSLTSMHVHKLFLIVLDRIGWLKLKHVGTQRSTQKAKDKKKAGNHRAFDKRQSSV